MGKHHTLKLPEHLYISPPSPQPSSFATAAALFSLKSAPVPSPAALFQDTSSTAFAVGDKIPGFRTSAAFFTTLRANINLDLDFPESTSNTPDSLRPTHLSSSISSLPPRDFSSPTVMADADFEPPSALNLPKATLSEDAPSVDAAQSQDPNTIPELTTTPATEDKQRIEALKLVADSVAQQRQITSRVLIFHPITFAMLAVIASLVYKYFYKGNNADWAIIGTTFSGVVMTVFASVRAAAGPYLEEAEKVGTWLWLSKGRLRKDEEASGIHVLDDEDEILVTRFGEGAIGTIIFRGVQPLPSLTSSPRKGRKSSLSQQTKTQIRAWTVAQKYRRKGVGTALLEDAVKIAKEKGWTAAGIEFAPDHANSRRVLPEYFNGPMNRREEKARQSLERVMDELETQKVKGRKRK